MLKSLELKVPPLIVVIAVGVGMWATARMLPGLSFQIPGGAWIALILAGLGIAIVVAGVVTFRKHRTSLNPLHPEAATKIVTTGIYRLTRNPMYLGLALVLLGWLAYLANAAAILWPAVFVGYMNKFQIMPEERSLLAHFGEEYAEYVAKVRRWL